MRKAKTPPGSNGIMSDKLFYDSFTRREPHAEHRPDVKKSLSDELGNLFHVDELKKDVRFWNQVFNYLRGRSTISTRETLFLPICGLCLVKPKEQKLLAKFRETGLRRLRRYLNYSNRREFQSQHLKLLTWSTLSLMSFYYSKSEGQPLDCNCFTKHKFYESKAVFRSAMYLVLPEKQSDVIKHSIRYMTLTGQWNSEDYDACIFQELLTMITKPELLVAKIIKQIEISQKEKKIQEALRISCTLASILEQSYWDKYLFNHLLHNCFNTLLKIYLLCSFCKDSAFTVDNAKFRMTIKVCIKNFISNIKDNKGLVSVLDSQAKCLKDETIPYDDRLEIIEMIAFCAQQHNTKFLRESITPDLLNLLLNGIQSPDKGFALSSHKIFHSLLDRHENLKYFIEPVYYFKGRSDFSINFEYGTEDVHFFKSFSKNFFNGIFHCLVTFTERHSLIVCYVTLCLVLVEIPEPVITINVIHVLITVQNEILRSALTMVTSAHIHAIIASLLSLICLVHQNEVVSLKRYVQEVVRFRTENSPHLLPPLQNRYDVATHHTTTYYVQLYFQEEEVLYALQKCWLGRRNNSTTK